MKIALLRPEEQGFGALGRPPGGLRRLLGHLSALLLLAALAVLFYRACGK